MNLVLLKNSLLVGGITSLLATGLGFAAALWLSTLPSRWRIRLLGPALLALAMPPFLVANCWLDLLGITGQWRAWFPVNLYSPMGVGWILNLLMWPISMLLALGALKRVEREQLESEPLLTGFALIRWLLWPMARTSLIQAAIIIFVLSLNHFTIPAILQVKVLPAEVWIAFSTHLDSLEAITVGWPLLIAPLLLIMLLRQTRITWPNQEGPATAECLKRQLGPGWQRLTGITTVALLWLSVGLPLLHLAGSPRTWAELSNVLPAVPGAIAHSFIYAVVSASVCVAIGCVSWRAPVGLILWLPFLAPGVLLGIGLIYVFNRHGLELVYRSSGIVILALTVKYLAIAWHGAAQAHRGMDSDLTDAARLDGAKRWRLFWHVHWPNIAPAAGAAWYVIYLLCLWDVEILLLICPPGGQTLAQNVFNLLHYGHTAQVNAYCLVLLVLALIPLALFGGWRILTLREPED